jgi:hypothetical protein
MYNCYIKTSGEWKIARVVDEVSGVHRYLKRIQTLNIPVFAALVDVPSHVLEGEFVRLGG